jgi:signal transduction histidine kinase/CheY-like chemotaxis protein
VAFARPEKAAHAAAIKSAAPSTDSDRIQARVLRGLTPVVVSDPAVAALTTSDIGPAGPARSVMCIPLVARETALGTLTLILVDSPRVYSAKDLDLAGDIARRAAVAIDHARMYELARQATRARDEVLAVVAHDLKNPLALITLGASTLLSGAPDPDRRQSRRQLEDMRRGAERMALLIHDLVDVRSLEVGQLSLACSVQPAAELLADTAALLQPLAEPKGIVVAIDAAESCHDVMCDRERTLQVLSNLVDNAIKFSPTGASVHMWTEPEDSMVRFSVRDHGPGIDPALLPHVFERRFRGRRTEVQGSGLGLHIAKVIVEAQGGQIRASSIPDAGSVFSFTLPVASAVSGALPACTPSTPATAPEQPVAGTVWVVDDDAEIRDALADILTHAGYAVVLAESGASACEQLQSHASAPSLLLLDAHVRALDDAAPMQAFMQRVRAASIPIVLLSSRDDVARQAETVGAVAHMRKPLQLGRLLQFVASHRKIG